MQKLGKALGSEVAITILVRDEVQAKPIFQSLWASIVEFQERFTRFHINSELSKFNAQSGKEIKVSPAFRKLLVTSKKYAEKSDGLYTPFILPALNRAGYIGSWPDTGDYDQSLNYSLRKIVSIDNLIINKSSAVIPANSALDFGGIGKGYLLDELSSYLEKSGINNYWLSLGGDIICSGFDLEKQAWKIGIADARDDEVAIETISNRNGKKLAMATSGTTIRKGIGWHHIIDPRSGFSADTDILTSTVVASPPAGGGVEADIYAKCLLILGSEQAKDFAKSKKISAIVQTLEHNGKQALKFGKKL